MTPAKTRTLVCEQNFASPKAAHIKSPELEIYTESSSTNTKHAGLTVLTVLTVFCNINNKGFPFVHGILILIMSDCLV